MNRRSKDLSKLLRWYPAQWRGRYGDELVSLMEDSLGNASPSLRLRVSTAWSGLRERRHQTGLIGDQQSPAHQLRAGSLPILCSWTAFMVAGASFSKLAEHFSIAMPVRSSGLAQDGFDTVAALGVAGMFVVLVGAGIAAPTLGRFLRMNGWISIRRRVIQAVVFTLVTGSDAVAVSFWAHHLSTEQRNGGSALYSWVFIALVICVAITLSLWTRVATSIAVRVEFSRTILLCEAVLASILCAVMIAVAVATAIWWQAVGTNAPWFIQGTRFGSVASPFAANIMLALLAMVVAGVASIIGVSRIAHAWREA